MHTHDAAREAGLGTLADLGFFGLDDQPDDDPVIVTGRKATRNHRLTDAEKEPHRLISRERAAGEHGFAHLKLPTVAAHRRPYRPLSGRRSRTFLGRRSLTRT
ncbi:hypothetical protein RKD24_000486 [Streptomyces calvus]